MGKAGAKKHSPKEIDEVYETLRAIEKKDWDMDSEKLGKHIKDTFEGTTGTDKEVGLAYRIACRVAHGTSKEEFVEFMNNGELPPIKLSSEEMQALRGGFLGFITGAIGAIRGLRDRRKNKKIEKEINNQVANDEELKAANEAYQSGSIGAADYKATRDMAMERIQGDATAKFNR